LDRELRYGVEAEISRARAAKEDWPSGTSPCLDDGFNDARAWARNRRMNNGERFCAKLANHFCVPMLGIGVWFFRLQGLVCRYVQVNGTGMWARGEGDSLNQLASQTSESRRPRLRGSQVEESSRITSEQILLVDRLR
jgi:hypothetical protein